MNKLLCYLSFCIIIISCKSDKDRLDLRESYNLVLTDGNIINIETGSISKGTIFINNNRIVKIIPSNENDVIEYVAQKVLDVSGKYILPGYWDNHVHFRGGDSLIEDNKEFLKLFLANGVTTVRDAGGDLAAEVVRWRKMIDDGELVGPSIFTSGAKIDGPNAMWAGSIGVESDADIAHAIDSLLSMKVDFIKIYDSTISPEYYLKTIQQAEKRGIITSGHMPFSVTLEETVTAGLDAVEHLYYILKGCSSQEKLVSQAISKGDYGFWQSMSILIETYDDSTANKTFQQLKEHDVFVVPTMHIGNVLSYLDETDHSQDKYLAFMSDGIIETYQRRIQGALNASDKAKRNRKALNATFKTLIKKLNEADVKILAGSDCGASNSYVYPGISLHQELAALVESGLTPIEVLRTSTYNGSQFLKKTKDYGQIGIDKIADLVVLNANPLKDITHSNNIFHVIKGGHIIDTSSFGN